MSNSVTFDENLKKAEKILSESPLIDGHNDLAWTIRKHFNSDLDKFNFEDDLVSKNNWMTIDIPSMRKGKLSAQFWAIFIRDKVQGQNNVLTTIEQIDLMHELIKKHSNHLSLALTADDILKNHSAGKISCLLGIEGSHGINNSIQAAKVLYHAGARYLTIAYMKNNDIADSSTDKPQHNGLSGLGKKMVQELNRIGMMIDLSHASIKTGHDVIDISKAPVIFSHSGAYSVTPHVRNVTDDLLERVPKNGGIVMVTFVGDFISMKQCEYSARKSAEAAKYRYLNFDDDAKAREMANLWEKDNPPPLPSISDLADHIDHIKKICGVDHIGLGSDFEGYEFGIKGLESAACYPAIFAELLSRGYSEEDLKKIAGQNMLRVMRDVQKSAVK